MWPIPVLGSTTCVDSGVHRFQIADRVVSIFVGHGTANSVDGMSRNTGQIDRDTRNWPPFRIAHNARQCSRVRRQRDLGCHNVIGVWTADGRRDVSGQRCDSDQIRSIGSGRADVVELETAVRRRTGLTSDSLRTVVGRNVWMTSTRAFTRGFSSSSRQRPRTVMP